MEDQFTKEAIAIKGKGWSNNHFPLKALRVKYAKKGLDVTFMWDVIAHIFN